MGSLSEYAEVLGPATRAAWPTVAEIVPAGISVEEGFTLYLQKYGLSVNHGSVHALVTGFGYFDDVLDNPILQGMVGEDVRDRVVGFFTDRHPAIVRSVVQGPERPGLL